jgi:hypothetical protein
VAHVTIGKREDYADTIPGEDDVARYDVRRLRRRFPWLRVLVGIALSILFILATKNAPKVPGIVYLIQAGIVVALIIVPMFLWAYGYTATGVLFLTTRRLLYVEDGTGILRRRRYVASVDLAWVNGVQALTQAGKRIFLGIPLGRGQQTYYLRIDTRGYTPINIGATSKKGRVAVFEPDAGSLQSVQELGARIRQLAVELPQAARAV